MQGRPGGGGQSKVLLIKTSIRGLAAESGDGCAAAASGPEKGFTRPVMILNEDVHMSWSAMCQASRQICMIVL